MSTGKVDGQSLTFQAINALGATGFVVNGWWHGAAPVVALNLVWLMISGVALWRITKRQKSST